MMLTAFTIVAIIAGAIPAPSVITRAFNKRPIISGWGLSNSAKAPSLIMDSLGKAN